MLCNKHTHTHTHTHSHTYANTEILRNMHNKAGYRHKRSIYNMYIEKYILIYTNTYICVYTHMQSLRHTVH